MAPDAWKGLHDMCYSSNQQRIYLSQIILNLWKWVRVDNLHIDASWNAGYIYIYRLAIFIVNYLNIKAIITSYFSYQHDACFCCNCKGFVYLGVWRVVYICIIKFINICIKAHQYLCKCFLTYMYKHLIIFSFYLCMCILCRNHMPAYIHLLFPACMVIITL